MCSKRLSAAARRISNSGAGSEVFSRGEELRAIGLDVPQAVELAQKLLELPVNKAITALAQLGDSVEDEQ